MRDKSEIPPYVVTGKPRGLWPGAEMRFVHLQSPNAPTLRCLSTMLMLLTCTASAQTTGAVK